MRLWSASLRYGTSRLKLIRYLRFDRVAPPTCARCAELITQALASKAPRS